MKRIFVFIFILAIGIALTQTAYSATYYMNADGSEDCANLRECFGIMSGGDTLIIRDGVYTGNDNMIDAYGDYGGCPPEGSPEQYTVVRAEHDGKVILDGEGVRRPILIRGDDTVDGYTGSSASHDYIEIRGLVAKNSNSGCIQVYYCNHIKLINCGAVDAADGNHMPIEIGRSTYCLLQGCYAWGNGRYQISVGGAHYCIIRNCVVRKDRVNPEGDPMGGIINYGNYHNEVQNCIVIDSTADDYYVNYYQDQGAFGNPGTSSRSDSGHVNFNNCIALNNHLRFGTSDWGQYHNDVYYTNCLGWDILTLNESSFYGSSGDVHFDRCTFGNVSTKSGTMPSGRGHFWGYNSNGLGGNINSTINSIIYNFNGSALFQQWEESDYNNIYGFTEGMPIDLYGSSTTNSIEIDPTVASLRYITRIEPVSPLSSAGRNGEQVGATIVKMYGKPNTLWGEDGYDKLQDGSDGQNDTNLWPFPNEDLIKEKMSQYVYDADDDSTPDIRGDRGFCVDGTGLYGGRITLTSYIWEYLGNPCPVDVCNYYDVNRDGEVNVQDVQAVANVILGTASNDNADATGDGSVNVQDIQGIVNVVLN